MNKKLKKKILFLIMQISLLCSFLSCKRNNQEIKYKIVDNEIFYSFNDIDIKFTKNKNILSKKDNEIIIYDYRDSDNPGIKIIDSYKIKSIKDMSNIIEILKQYNNEFESGNRFKRDNFTMLVEWLIHNACYYNGIRIDNTKDTDFNNNELKYLCKK